MEVVAEALELDTELENRNYKLYPKEVMVRAVEEFEERIKRNGGFIPGECQPPPDDLVSYIRPETMSHLVKHLFIRGNRVISNVNTVGKWKELAEKGVIWGSCLRTIDYGEDGKEIDLKKLKGPVVVHKATIVTVDLLYREEWE